MQERKMWHKTAGVENLGKENVARGKCRGGKCEKLKIRLKTAGVENVAQSQG